ncbi:hypothetical protein MB02_07840 [Croceicoccus estronivorus]|uniref:hypothetical protein n=1 Tax=Croceicoccus estronivorus TaxID=1172626 RepID=UPI0008326BED|nr:hypothetical protein [Croceicoccus estronivorus]OCC24169.1 hypothetical protein MB02_07840 [Croceicoccus estronivorus]
MTIPITSVTLDQSLSRAGPAAASFARLWTSLWAQDQLPQGLLELCRLTFARLHRDQDELAASNPLAGERPDMDVLSRLVAEDKAHDSPAFTDGEKAVLLFAEYYWTDTQSIPDEVADRVKAHFGDPGLVLLIEALGCIDGRIRTARCLRDMAASRSKMEEVAHVE